MRALLPSPSDGSVDILDAYAVPTGGDRPFVRCNMISSIDGAVTLNGRSGALGGPPDRQVFAVLRSWADVILVGAGTMRAEGYGPAKLSDELRAAREARGLPPVPPIAVVTRSAEFDWSSPFFTDAEARPLVVTVAGTQVSSDLAEVVVAGDERVEPARVLDALAERGHRSVLLEGGPGLNADVIHAQVLDELCLTISPKVVGGDGPRVLSGPELAHPLGLSIVHLLEEDGFLFYRLAV